MKTKNYWFLMFLVLGLALPVVAFGSVESSMAALQSKLLGTILPVMSVLGLLIAGLAYLAGSANARQYLWYAIIGAAVGFGAESIVSFIRSIVH
jgi:type IV secretory pathway VirB2 component (pilin)